jgi:hypothetical protein
MCATAVLRFLRSHPKENQVEFLYLQRDLYAYESEGPLKGKYIKLMRHDTKYYGGSAASLPLGISLRKIRNIFLAMQILQGAIYHFPCICSAHE